MAVTRALRFSDHVIKRNGGSGDENGTSHEISHMRTRFLALSGVLSRSRESTLGTRLEVMMNSMMTYR